MRSVISQRVGLARVQYQAPAPPAADEAVATADVGAMGRWLPGLAVLRADVLSFRAVPPLASPSFSGALRSIARVEVRQGTVHVTVPEGVLSLRCWAPDRFADDIRRAARASWPTP